MPIQPDDGTNARSTEPARLLQGPESIPSPSTIGPDTASRGQMRVGVLILATVARAGALHLGGAAFRPLSHAAPSRVSAIVAQAPAPAQMDERIYSFNKAVIDTVYDVICVLYPVTGSPRDFARFYVLETVARVPYFAYLSVMHLRETFGERTPGDSERMRTHYAEADNELHQ